MSKEKRTNRITHTNSWHTANASNFIPPLDQKSTNSGDKPIIEIRMLGKLVVKKGDQLITFQSQKATSIFCYIVYAKSETRERLQQIFWPDAPAKHQQHNLRTALWHIYKVLGEQHSEEPYLRKNRLQVEIPPYANSLLWLDTTEFDKALAQVVYPVTKLSIHHLTTAATLYRGRFLQNVYDNWCFPIQEYFDTKYAQAIDDLTYYYLAQENYRQALQWLHHAWEKEVWCEQILTKFMRVLEKQGHISRALDVCSDFAQRLQEQKGISLGQETIKLYYKLQYRKSNGRFPSSS